MILQLNRITLKYIFLNGKNKYYCYLCIVIVLLADVFSIPIKQLYSENAYPGAIFLPLNHMIACIPTNIPLLS